MPRKNTLLGALALLALLLLPGTALAQSSIDVYNDFLEDGQLDGSYSDGVLESTIGDATLFQYAPPLTVERLRRAARLALAGGSPSAPPPEPSAATATDGTSFDGSSPGGTSPGGSSGGGTGAAAAAGDPDEPGAPGSRSGTGSASSDPARGGGDDDDLAALPDQPLIPPSGADATGDALGAASGGGSQDDGFGAGTIALLVGGGILLLGGGLAAMRLLGGRGVDGA